MLNVSPLPPPHKRSLLRRILLPILVLSCLAGTGYWCATWLLDTGSDPSVAGNIKPTSNREDCTETIKDCVKKGETVSSILGGLLNPQELHELALQCRKVFPLSRIYEGQPYRLSRKEGGFKQFAYDIDSEEQLIITREKEGFDVSRQPIDYTVNVVTIKGEIQSSLFEAMTGIGESEALAIRLADIFAWDIDFFQDIQPGDIFEVLVEKRYRKGLPAGDGRLLAARFTNNGTVFKAFYFQDGDHPPEFYDQQGKSLRKAFLKAPLSFTRISSGFNMRRLHPITRRIQAHPAVDYAAPKGTPIHTVGDGTVIFAAYKRFNGKCVKVRHPNGWATMYNHMSRFARNIRKGSKIRQGQVIGFVGSTGRSTGPHLDFRIYRKGVAVNPLKVKSPPAMPVSRANMASFKAMTAKRLAMLNGRLERQTATAAIPPSPYGSGIGSPI